MIGREILRDEQASPNYRLREVQKRLTGEVSWEVVEAASDLPVATGLLSRDEALRIVRGWEQLNLKVEGGLSGHIVPN